jgi:glycosyltransferase involved in cell wall biosynthesis
VSPEGTRVQREERRGRPAKLVLWAGSFEPAGTQRFMLEFLKRMDRDRFDPMVFSTLARGKLLPAVRALDVPVHEFGTGTGVLSPRTLRDLTAAARFLRREQVDILSCMLGLTTIVGPFVGRAAGVPVVVNNQRNLSYWLHGGPKETAYRYVNRRVVDGILVNSDAARRELVKRFGVDGSKITNVGVGTDIERIEAAPPADGLRRRLGLEGRKIVGIVAKLSRVKGHMHFLEAAAFVSKAHGDVAFLVVGDGPERERLEHAAADLGLSAKVHFVGVRDDVPSILKSIDVFVLSSTSEGSPNVILEAMAAGAPVVATRVGGIPDLVAEGESGLLVEPGDSASMARAIKRLLADGDGARAMGERGRQLARERYDIDAVVRRMEDAFDSLLESARSARRGPAARGRPGEGR